jgi:hypothetical protein
LSILGNISYSVQHITRRRVLYLIQNELDRHLCS